MVWRILLEAIPLDPREWDEAQKRNYETYELWKKELLSSLDSIKATYIADGET